MLSARRGSDYVAIVRITDRPGNVLAAAGQTCERVPAEVLESLELRGKIRRASGVLTSRPTRFIAGDGAAEHVVITPADSPGQEEE